MKSSPSDVKPRKSALRWGSSEAPYVLLKGRLQCDLVEMSVWAVTFEKKQGDFFLIYLTPLWKSLWLKSGQTWAQNLTYFEKDQFHH